MMQRGDIFWANLEPRSGSEQKGRRPVIVISHNGFNKTPNWQSIIVIPLSTSVKQKSRGLTAIEILASETKLKTSSIALCHQITTLDRSKLVQHISTLSSDTLKKIEEGIKYALQLY